MGSKDSLGDILLGIITGRLKSEEMPTYIKPTTQTLNTDILIYILEDYIKYIQVPTVILIEEVIKQVKEIIQELDQRYEVNAAALNSIKEVRDKEKYIKLRNEVYQLIGWENHFNATALMRSISDLSDVEILDLTYDQLRGIGQKNMTEQTYSINIKSRFILTQTAVKRAFGPGFQILSVEIQKDASQLPIIDVDSAALAIIQTGYRALARAYHPDLGGSEEIMKILNKCRTELKELVESLRS